MLKYFIIEDKYVNGIHYQLLKQEDEISSRFCIITPDVKKDCLSFKLLSDWAHYNLAKTLFDNLKTNTEVIR
jgi:hypothetical protein